MTMLGNFINAFKVQPAAPMTARAKAVAAATAAVESAARPAGDAFVRGGSNPQLINANQALTKRGEQITQASRALAAELATPGITVKRFAQIQMELDGLNAQAAEIKGLKGEVAKLARTPGAKPADVQKMADLATEATNGNVSSRRMGQIAVEMQDLARNAGRAVPSDRALFAATIGLNNRMGDLDQRAADLTREAGAPGISQMRMAQIQIQLDDLARTREVYGQIKHEADRLADNPRTSSADAQKMAQLLTEAGTGNTSIARLFALTLETSQVGR